MFVLDEQKKSSERTLSNIFNFFRILKCQTTGYVYDKHKIFLYKEDFEKFAEGLEDAVKYIKARLNGLPEAAVKGEPAPEDVEISAEDKDIF